MYDTVEAEEDDDVDFSLMTAPAGGTLVWTGFCWLLRPDAPV